MVPGGEGVSPRVYWELQEASRAWGSTRATGHFKGICILRNIVSGRRLVGALRAWAGVWLSGLWESVRPFYFDPKFVRANAARTKPFMTKWPIRKPLDFPPMLQTCSREEENQGGRFKQSKVTCSAHKCGGQLVGRLSGGLAGGRRW